MQKKIKLLHITSSLKIGGAEMVLCDLIKNMDSTKFEHHVIYFHDGPHSISLKELGIQTYQIKGLLSLYDPIFFTRLYKQVKKIQPDCIHSVLWAANISGRIIARLLNIPIACAMHNNVDQDGFVRNLLDHVTIKMANKLIAVSAGVAESIVKRDVRLPFQQVQDGRKKIEVIPNGIDIAALHKKAAQAQKKRADLGLSDTHFIIGSVGRFEPVKRYDVMLDNFAMLYVTCPFARLVLVGIGSQEAMLVKKAEKLGVSKAVIFVVGQQACHYYSLFDCFTMSSDKEGISIALLEAMSFGLPCVVTHSESSHPVLQHMISGLIVPAGTPQKLAHAWQRIIQDASLKELLATSASKTVVRNFSGKGMILAYEKVIEELC